MKIFLPEKLNLSDHIRRNPPPPIPKFSEAKLALLLCQIIVVPSNNRKLRDNDGFVPLATKILQRLVREYRQYLDYARDSGVILESPQFIQTVQCRHFKFHPQYDGIAKIYEPKNFRIPKFARTHFTNRVDLPKKFLFLAEPFESGLLSVKYEEAKDFFRRQYEHYLKNPDQIPWNYKKRRHKDPVEIYNTAMFILERLKIHDYNLKIDTTSGRLHSILTNMPKAMRHFLLFDGKHLFTIDVSNCQPYMMLKLFEPEFYLECLKKIEKRFFAQKLTNPLEKWREEGVRTGIDEQFNLYSVSGRRGRGIFRSSTDVNTLITLVNQVKTLDVQGFQKFYEITTTGGYYDFFQESLTHEVGEKFEDRNQVKVESLRILFTDNSYLNQEEAKAKKWFSRYFYTIYDITHFFKQYDKAFLPVLLQAMEAEIMLNRVSRRLFRERQQPDTPFFTIHDCMMSTVGQEELVQRVVKEEFARCMGVPPHLKFENYSSNSRKIVENPF